MDDGIPSSSSDSAMKYKKNQNRCATFKIQMNKNVWYLIMDDAMFNISSKRPDFLLNPLRSILYPVVERIYIKQLEY